MLYYEKLKKRPRKQGNREYMRKSHMTRQLFEASGPQGHFFEKTKKKFIDMV